MRFLPIVERELRVAARRRSAFWVRVGAAVAAVGVGAVPLWLGGDWSTSASLGRQLFDVLTRLTFFLCVLAGPMLTADALSEEKREGTLGFLFLTDLRAADVVLGKLAAASVATVFGLLAVVPVVAVGLLLAGSIGSSAAVLVLLN
jgi:ABC-type transport system involved in multi-copper enzyme maturation permease subunit